MVWHGMAWHGMGTYLRGQSIPGLTMFVLRMHPSMYTPASHRTIPRVVSVSAVRTRAVTLTIDMNSQQHVAAGCAKILKLLGGWVGGCVRDSNM